MSIIGRLLWVVVVAEIVSVAGRAVLSRYARSIGAGDPAFNSDPTRERQRGACTPS